jgi:hypothetical protein
MATAELKFIEIINEFRNYSKESGLNEKNCLKIFLLAYTKMT